MKENLVWFEIQSNSYKFYIDKKNFLIEESAVCIRSMQFIYRSAYTYQQKSGQFEGVKYLLPTVNRWICLDDFV